MKDLKKMRKFGVWIEEDDYELLKRVTEYERLTRSKWARRVITQALRRAKPNLPDERENE